MLCGVGCTYSSIHLFRLKITVGCLTSTYPSIHVEDTLKITVGCPLCAYPSVHFSLDEDTLEDHGRLPNKCAYPSVHVETLKITGRLSGVWCGVCGVVWCGVLVCVVVLWWCVCVVCGEAWHSLSLSLLFSLLPLLFPFLSLSYLSFSLFFFFFSCSFSYSCSCSQRRLLPPPLPPLLESVNKAANKVATKGATEDV